MYVLYKGYHLDLSKVCCINTSKRESDNVVFIDVKITFVGCYQPSIEMSFPSNDIETKKLEEFIEAFEASANIDLYDE